VARRLLFAVCAAAAASRPGPIAPTLSAAREVCLPRALVPSGPRWCGLLSVPAARADVAAAGCRCKRCPEYATYGRPTASSSGGGGGVGWNGGDLMHCEQHRQDGERPLCLVPRRWRRPSLAEAASPRSTSGGAPQQLRSGYKCSHMEGCCRPAFYVEAGAPQHVLGAAAPRRALEHFCTLHRRESHVDARRQLVCSFYDCRYAGPSSPLRFKPSCDRVPVLTRTLMHTIVRRLLACTGGVRRG